MGHSNIREVDEASGRKPVIFLGHVGRIRSSTRTQRAESGTVPVSASGSAAAANSWSHPRGLGAQDEVLVLAYERHAEPTRCLRSAPGRGRPGRNADPPA